MTTSVSSVAADSIVCPVCGGANVPDAVFCANPACRKALGPFRYVREELQGRTLWHERVADRVVAFVGRSHFIVVHVAWVLAWVALNTGLVMLWRPFDVYPFGLLGVLLGVEAILLTGFVLIAQNRERQLDELRAELDYEAAAQTHRRVAEIERLVREIATRLEVRDRGDVG